MLILKRLVVWALEALTARTPLLHSKMRDLSRLRRRWTDRDGQRPVSLSSGPSRIRGVENAGWRTFLYHPKRNPEYWHAGLGPDGRTSLAARHLCPSPCQNSSRQRSRQRFYLVWCLTGNSAVAGVPGAFAFVTHRLIRHHIFSTRALTKVDRAKVAGVSQAANVLAFLLRSRLLLLNCCLCILHSRWTARRQALESLEIDTVILSHQQPDGVEEPNQHSHAGKPFRLFGPSYLAPSTTALLARAEPLSGVAA